MEKECDMWLKWHEKNLKTPIPSNQSEHIILADSKF